MKSASRSRALKLSAYSRSSRRPRKRHSDDGSTSKCCCISVIVITIILVAAAVLLWCAVHAVGPFSSEDNKERGATPAAQKNTRTLTMIDANGAVMIASLSRKGDEWVGESTATDRDIAHGFLNGVKRGTTVKWRVNTTESDWFNCLYRNGEDQTHLSVVGQPRKSRTGDKVKLSTSDNPDPRFDYNKYSGKTFTTVKYLPAAPHQTKFSIPKTWKEWVLKPDGSDDNITVHASYVNLVRDPEHRPPAIGIKEGIDGGFTFKAFKTLKVTVAGIENRETRTFVWRGIGRYEGPKYSILGTDEPCDWVDFHFNFDYHQCCDELEWGEETPASAHINIDGELIFPRPEDIWRRNGSGKMVRSSSER